MNQKFFLIVCLMAMMAGSGNAFSNVTLSFTSSSLKADSSAHTSIERIKPGEEMFFVSGDVLAWEEEDEISTHKFKHHTQADFSASCTFQAHALVLASITPKGLRSYITPQQNRPLYLLYQSWKIYAA